MKKIGLFSALLGLAFGWVACTEEATPKQKVEKKEEVKEEKVTSPYKVIGYVGGYKGEFKAEDIQAKKLTHINYAFANVKDGKAVTEQEQDSANFAQLKRVKEINPTIKILVSIGGWTWSKNFSDAALTDSSRQIFAQSAVDLLNKYELDGIDIDWEYPGQIGDNNKFRLEDKQNFTLFLKALRDALDVQGKKDDRHYLLTIASGASQAYLDNTEMDEAHKYLDFINIMTYDFHGEWEPKTGHLTNLSIQDSSTNMSAEIAVDQHIKAGIPVNKIVLGVAFYGRAWGNVGSENNGLYQPATAVEGKFKTTYDTIQNHLANKNGYVYHWDTTANAPFLYNDSLKIFVTYDDTLSIRKKCDFIKQKGLGGAMFWEYQEDSKIPETNLLNVLDRELKPNK
ncbi:MAG: glycoside hydrolase family 18 protein [Cytophagales bacterium]|nr:glycoside hydrolase family 18 protein [Cytophagales bacterium]